MANASPPILLYLHCRDWAFGSGVEGWSSGPAFVRVGKRMGTTLLGLEVCCILLDGRRARYLAMQESSEWVGIGAKVYFTEIIGECQGWILITTCGELAREYDGKRLRLG